MARALQSLTTDHFPHSSPQDLGLGSLVLASRNPGTQSSLSRQESGAFAEFTRDFKGRGHVVHALHAIILLFPVSAHIIFHIMVPSISAGNGKAPADANAATSEPVQMARQERYLGLLDMQRRDGS
jgi:hypothetical protein